MRVWVIVMGVSGCGKSTVGGPLAAALGVPFGEGDDFHRDESVQKMARGEALTDDDRWPWLHAIGAWLASHENGAVVSCSALKHAYREVLRESAPGLLFIHLAGDADIVRQRVAARSDHYMPASLVDSQLAALEPLRPDELGTTIDFAQPTEAIVAEAVAAITDLAQQRNVRR